MSNFLRFILSVFFLYATLFYTAEQAHATEQEAELQPALWQVEYQGSTSYLFGSVHIGKASWYPLPATVTDAFKQSTSLIVELNTLTHGEEVQQAMALPSGITLKQKLAANTYKKLQQYALAYGVPIKAFEQLKPWAAATIAAVLPYMKQGLSPVFGIDLHFINAATKQGKNIVELETVAFQLNMLEQMFKDESAFVQLLDAPSGDAKALVEYWGAGDMENLDRLTLAQISPQQLDLLLYNRNRQWVSQLKKMLVNNQSYFMVVGAAHLTGQNGVPALLAAQGIKVKRIN